MSDFNYDAYQEELKEQKQQWRYDLLAERKEEERRREKFIPFYSAAVLVSYAAKNTRRNVCSVRARH